MFRAQRIQSRVQSRVQSNPEFRYYKNLKVRVCSKGAVEELRWTRASTAKLVFLWVRLWSSILVTEKNLQLLVIRSTNLQ